ncbi:Homeodomain-like superfamily protein [Striga hermonthica]|uniref:Homeodomain-like superfamily protein n=1 Tax=Striga hermonthica TaxID=68872 RepID=A0A9N7NYP4_STRHE|nr:Homeodomain-like superfamily protein [Striga hermonthica]
MAFDKNKDDNSNDELSFLPKTISDVLNKASSISEFSDQSSPEMEFSVRSLEDEMKKVDAFKHELPLCMQLLKHGIERLKSAESTLSKTSSNSEGNERAKMSIDLSEKRSWMSSVQLWTPPGLQYENSFFTTQNQDSFSPLKPRKCKHEESSRFLRNREGGAFSPFKKNPGLLEQHKKRRRCWSPELHRLFVYALQNLGGAEVATPKQIREHMKVEDLTNDEVKSHLQDSRQKIFECIA